MNKLKENKSEETQNILKDLIINNNEKSLNLIIKPIEKKTIENNDKIIMQPINIIKEVEILPKEEKDNFHLQRILKHMRFVDQKQRYLDLYKLIVDDELPSVLIELNKLDKPLNKKQIELLSHLKKSHPFMPKRFFELSICTILPPLYYMLPLEDMYNVEIPRGILPKRKKIKTCSLGVNRTIKKEYKCKIEGCNKVYTSAYGLRYHEERGHIINSISLNVKEYVFICEFKGCRKSYKQKNGLRYHLKKSHNINISELNSQTLQFNSVSNEN